TNGRVGSTGWLSVELAFEAGHPVEPRELGDRRAGAGVPRRGERAEQPARGDEVEPLRREDEAGVPSRGGAAKPRGVGLGDQEAERERVREAEVTELAGRRLGGGEVAAGDGAGEAAVCRSLRGHRTARSRGAGSSSRP